MCREWRLAYACPRSGAVRASSSICLFSSRSHAQGDTMRARPPGLLDKTWQSVTQSQLWRSIFRHGYPDTPLNQSLVLMGNVFLHLHPVKVSRKAMKITYTWCLGGLSFFLFLVLTITGIFLMFYFAPEQTVAYADIQQINSAVI